MKAAIGESWFWIRGVDQEKGNDIPRFGIKPVCLINIFGFLVVAFWDAIHHIGLSQGA
jgi:hypothetical protein